MAEQTKVSVVLTSYNHAKYLREAIDSVLNQTYSDFELIIWDDASTDGSWEIINSYSDPRIRSFRNETNQHGGNINRALSQGANGEYIAIQHSDDVWEPQKLEKQMAFLDENPQIGAVFSNAFIIGENGEPFEDKSHVYYSRFDQPNRSRHEWLNYFFKHGNAICHPSVLIRNVCYEECGLYRYGLTILTDFDMWVRLCLKYEIYVLPEKLIRFRVRANGRNTSTGGSEMRSRRPFEYLQVMNNYRKISTPQELIRIFPDAEQYIRTEGFDLGFALGMVALGARTDKFSKFFGLVLLFEAINNPERARKISELYDFEHGDLIELTAQHDVFSAGWTEKLIRQTSDQEQQTQALSSQLQAVSTHAEELTRHLQEITNSKAWKMVTVLRQVRSILLPTK